MDSTSRKPGRPRLVAFGVVAVAWFGFLAELWLRDHGDAAFALAGLLIVAVFIPSLIVFTSVWSGLVPEAAGLRMAIWVAVAAAVPPLVLPGAQRWTGDAGLTAWTLGLVGLLLLVGYFIETRNSLPVDAWTAAIGASCSAIGILASVALDVADPIVLAIAYGAYGLSAAATMLGRVEMPAQPSRP